MTAGDLEPNAVLVGCPQPIGVRHVHVELDERDVRASAKDGSGLHVWSRTSLFETWQGGAPLRVYKYAGPVPLQCAARNDWPVVRACRPHSSLAAP